MGEAGLDMGGLTKEWFLLLVRKVFQQEYGMTSQLMFPVYITTSICFVVVVLGMFTYDRKSRAFWFCSNRCDTYQEFHLVGVVSFKNFHISTILYFDPSLLISKYLLFSTYNHYFVITHAMALGPNQ